MKPVVVLAYDGVFAAAEPIAALARRHQADVVTMTVDIGQSRDLRAIRDLAVAAGAVRAHVFDAVDEFARQCVLPALRSTAAPVPLLTGTTSLAYPLIAARLIEVARSEGARIVAHGGGDELSDVIRGRDGALQVLALDVHGQPAPVPRIAPCARHLLQRPVADPGHAHGVAAHVEIEFDEAVPVAINGVTLSLPELIESLSLLGGEHGIGHGEPAPAPGALVLDAAYRALDWASGVVRLELLDGRHRVLSARARTPALVTHA